MSIIARIGIALRMENLKAMHEKIVSMGDEKIYEVWVSEGVPDEPNDNDFEFIATDEEVYQNTLALYEELVREG